MSSTRGSVHIIWPGIIQRAVRDTGSKLKRSLRLIAGFLLINTFPYIPGFEAGWAPELRVEKMNEYWNRLVVAMCSMLSTARKQENSVYNIIMLKP